MLGKSNRRGMLKKLMAFSLAGVMMFGSVSSVSAATLKDVFDAEYYADTYEDLEKAFGDNKKALYNHYRTTGKTEGRVMSELINVVEYRNAYPDLDAAFGDNWDAYVNHYITYGFEEGRSSFGSFDARAYADRYPDLKEAFGYDVLKLYQHYMNYGREEGRDAGPVYVAPTFYWSGSSWSGESFSSTPTIDNTTPVTTSARLVDPETGDPIANATITFTRTSFIGLTEVVDPAEVEEPETEEIESTPGYYVVQTDENGFYTVQDMEPGVYSVVAEAPGYMTLTLNTVNVTVSPTGSALPPTFEMLSSDMSGTNVAAGIVNDATTGAGVAGVTVNVRANWNTYSGDVVASVVTDESGNYSVELARGYYTLEFVREGYASNFVNVSSSNAIGATHCTLNPTTTTGEVGSTEYRIVLTWGETPSDLDSHLVGPNGDGGYFHVYYADKIYQAENGEIVASLDVDDVSSYGPETVTVVEAAANETYYYSVKNFSDQQADSTTMAASGANIKVYQGASLVAEYNVPVNGVGYIWNVFKIENGQIVTLNGYGGDESTMYGHYLAQ